MPWAYALSDMTSRLDLPPITQLTYQPRIAYIVPTAFAAVSLTSTCGLQAPELSYRFHPKYPLGKKGPLEQITGNSVLRRLRDMATDLGIHEHTDFCSEVETIRMEDDRYIRPHHIRLPLCNRGDSHASQLSSNAMRLTDTGYVA